MVTGTSLGQILALVGFVLLVLSTLGGRRRGPGGRKPLSRWQRLAGFGAISLILVGLLLMWGQR